MIRNRKINLEDVTFLIPLRIDSVHRLENLIETTNYILENFRTNIHILEASEYNNHFLEKLLNGKPFIKFIRDLDPIFHRTYYINQLVKDASTPIVAVWDSDVIVLDKQIIESVDILRQEKADFVFPYNNSFLDTTPIVRELYLEKKDIEILRNNENKMRPLYLPVPVGGGFFANRRTYIKSGIENENFYGWGAEDGERVSRWSNLEYKTKRVNGNIYHLYHQRNLNSVFHSSKQREIKKNEVKRLAMLSYDQLLNEVESWAWRQDKK